MSNRILYIPKEKKHAGKRKKSRTLWIIGGITLCIVVIAGGIMIVRLHAFQIQTISVQGLHSIHESDIERQVTSVLIGSYAFGLIPYRSLFAAPIQVITDTIAHRFPLIAEVHVKKEFPHMLAINVRERIMFGILCNDTADRDGADKEIVPEEQIDIQCAYVDTEGIAYESAPKTEGFLITKVLTDSPVIAIGTQVIDPLMMRRIVDIKTKLPPVIGSSIVGYQLLRNVAREVHVISKDKFSIIINRDDDLDHALSVLATILKKEIGSRRKNLDYIDLRFGNKVFYKLR